MLNTRILAPVRAPDSAASSSSFHEEAAGAPIHMREPGAFILHYVRARAPHFTALFLAVFAAAGFGVAVQYGLKLLVDAMAGTPGNSAVWTALSILVALIAAESLFWRISGWLGCRVTVAMGVDVRLDLFNHLNSQPMRYFAEQLAGSLGQRITQTAGNFGALANAAVWRVAPPAIDFLGALIVFTFVDWRMMLALGGSVTLVTAGLIVFGERGRHLHRAYAGHHSGAGGDLIDSISNMWAVKAFSARSRELARLRDQFQGEADAQRASWMHTEKARILHDVALCAIAGTMLAWSVHLWSQGRITPGDVVLVSALTFRILHGSREVALALVDMVQQFGFIEETLRVIGRTRTVLDPPAAPALIASRGSVVFRNVSFGYGHGREDLHDISFEIPAGQKVGIVGPSGAGKSTCINLVQRLYDVDKGAILIDGQKVTAVAQDSLRAALAVVPQEITLFHRTILENIRFARPDASEEQIVAAARAAHCDGFIRRLPQGYDTVVGERGARLSGGQRQRIGIARAFLKDAPIIILDEATSGLDTESEMEIQRALVEQMRTRTVIAVAHRLSTLTLFDRIIVLNGGRIVEDGPVNELRRRGGFFDRMWRRQAGEVDFAEGADKAA